MYESRKKEKVKACIAIAFIVLAILITGIIVMKYSVEGETNPPFKLSKITIVSTAEGVENHNSQEKWNFNIFQNNDIYFSIEKNGENNKEEIIESIVIDNIQITKQPKLGTVKKYMPNSSDGELFTYSDEYEIKSNNLVYKGAAKSNAKTLEIGNQGGTSIIRFSNADIGKYISDEDEEIKHDGSLLNKTNATMENIEFEVNFDFKINLKNKSYVANISLTLPANEKLFTEGTSSKEIIENFGFKRTKD